MSKGMLYAIGVGGILVVALGILFWSRGDLLTPGDAKQGTHKETKEERPSNRISLSEQALKAAQIEIAEASERETTALVAVTGTIEANQEKTQQATPLISGRVERVNVALGNRVEKGAILAVISSPEVADMHGRFHQAETRLNLAQQNFERVQRAENRAGVLQAKAKLDEADASLKRTRRLIELGAAAGKDLTAAETAYASAKAEYDFQSNIPLNRELQAARSEVETARVETAQLRSALAAVDADSEGEGVAASHNTSIVNLRSPVAGIVTERTVNAGAGIEAGKPLFTIADLSTLWVIANIPEGRLGALRVGTAGEIRSAELGDRTINGRVAYIDPALNEETRTGRVRIEIANPGSRLKTGMFVEVSFPSAGPVDGKAPGRLVAVPDAAVQRIGDRAIVFIPGGNAGEFEARDIELGEAMGAWHEVRTGLRPGDRVVTRGSFVLKTQLMKAQLGEE